MGSYLFFLLILACPLAMILMMRGMMGGGHGGDANGHAQNHTAGNGHSRGDTTTSLQELRRQRGDLDRQIEEREAEEKASPVGGGRR